VDCKAVDSLISCLKDCRRPAFPGETGGIDPPPGAKSAEHSASLRAATDRPGHDIDARSAELAQVSLEASLNSAAARLHVATHRSDIATTFIRNRRRPSQHGPAPLG